jgi:hypothetical protein
MLASVFVSVVDVLISYQQYGVPRPTQARWYINTGDLSAFQPVTPGQNPTEIVTQIP